jgi:hypothetical protein
METMKASHRLIQTILATHYKGRKVSKEDMAQIERIFAKMNGSWFALFNGSVEHVVLLKKVIKTCVDRKTINKS